MRSRKMSATYVCFLAVASWAQSTSLPVNFSYGGLPLVFEANEGQTDSAVKFLTRGGGYTAFLTSTGMTLSLRSSESATDADAALATRTVELNFVGAINGSLVVGEDQQQGKVNYFLGHDAALWYTNIPTYAKVRYRDIYPGIDLLYHGTSHHLEYDLEIQPGADPRAIEFEIRGSDQLKVDTLGNLVVTIGGRDVRLQCPVVFQQVHGRRIPVDGAYVLKDSTHVSFHVAQYDATMPLVIDPVLIDASYLGGTGADQANGIAVDSVGNVYVAGTTTSVNFPGANLGSLAQNTNHVFVAKLNATGTSLVYADYIGGNNVDVAAALVLDSANEVYVTGNTQSTDFPVINAFQSTQPGPNPGFVTRVSADGSRLLYSTYLGGNTLDQPAGIAIDSMGEVYVAGYTMSTNFPVKNAYQSTAAANGDGLFGTYGFLTKFSADGSSLVYSTYFAGNLNGVEANLNHRLDRPRADSSAENPPYSAVTALSLDSDGNAYLAGITNTYNFPTTTGAYITTYNAPQNNAVGFVSKFFSSGSIDYSTYFYGSTGDNITIAGIAVDGTGSAYITGSAVSDGTFPVTTTSICNPTVEGAACGLGYVTKFDPAGATLLYSTFLGPANYAFPQAIVLDSSDDAYIVAQTQSSSFQTSNPIELYSNQKDLILVEIDPEASTQLFATYLGGSGDETPGGVAVDASGNIYIAGTTSSTDFPVTKGAVQGQLTGSTNTFFAKIGAGTLPTVSLSPNMLQFSPLPVGSTSQPQQVTVRNMSNLSLSPISITASGDFAQSGNCGTSLPPASACTLSVTFTPSAVGPRSGSILSTDTGASSPQLVSLSGTGQGALALVLPLSVAFGGTPVDSSSSRQVTLTNQGNIPLSISNIQITGAYAQTNNCSSSVAAGASCTFNIVFAPTATGNQTGSLTIADNAATSPQTVTLSGTGSDFSLTTSTNAATVQVGNTATYTLNVAGLGGNFNSPVTLVCSGAPVNAACSVSPISVTPGANTASATVTITTTTAAASVWPPRQQSIFAVCFSGLGVFGTLLIGTKRKNKHVALIVLTLFITSVLMMSACAGGTGVVSQQTKDVAPGTYQVTVTGTSGGDQHSVSLTLNVISANATGAAVVLRSPNQLH